MKTVTVTWLGGPWDGMKLTMRKEFLSKDGCGVFNMVEQINDRKFQDETIDPDEPFEATKIRTVPIRNYKLMYNERS